MSDYSVTLSTTEPNNYVGLIKLRQGDVASQSIQATITANGQLFNFDHLAVFFNAVLPNGYVVRDKVTNVDYANSKLNYVVADSFLQEVAQVTAWFSFENDEKIIDSTKNFQYSVIGGWKECIPQGNYIYELSEIQREIEEIISNKDFTSIFSKISSIEKKYDEQLAEKANQTALNVEKARIDSFTTLAVGSTTGDAELIDGRTGADGITYANIGGAVRGQVSGLKSDVDANFTFVTQLLKASARVNGKYYYRDTHIKGDNADFAVYPEIPIYKGKTYNLVDAVGIFTTVSYDGGATATSLKLGTSTQVSDFSFTATGDGLL